MEYVLTTQGPGIAIALAGDPDFLVLDEPVNDLDEIQVGRLFDRFFTIEAARNSTGLGLAIAKTLVERMGGTITAEHDGICLTVIIRFRQTDTLSLEDFPTVLNPKSARSLHSSAHPRREVPTAGQV